MIEIQIKEPGGPDVVGNSVEAIQCWQPFGILQVVWW